MGALLFPIYDRSRYSHSFKARSMPQLHTCRRQRVLQKRWGYWVNCGQCVWNSGRYTRNGAMRARQTIHSHALPRSYKRSRIQWKTSNSATLSSPHQWLSAYWNTFGFCSEVGWMWMTLEFSKASCSLFSELQWNLISFGSYGGILTHISNNIGRGVWESNPPGTAPSDPSAVLKTVRPTGAPTPPCFAQLNKREI